MTTDRRSKSTVDAVNDAIGALSDLLHSLRAHARAHARAAAKTTSGTPRRRARGSAGAVNGAMSTAKRVVRKAGSAGERLIDRAANVWHHITGPDEDDDGRTVVVTRARRVRRATKR